MDLECDHTEPHTPCTGRDNKGKSRTRASAAYPLGLLSIIVAIAALISGVPTETSNLNHTPNHDTYSIDSNVDTKNHDNWYVSFPFDTHECRSMDEWQNESWYGGQDECFLARRKLEIYWDRVKDLPPEKPSTHADVSFHESVPEPIKQKVLDGIQQYKRILDAPLDGIPLVVNGPQVKIKLKDDAKPRRCPEPIWGHGAKRAVLTEWAKEALRTGEFEHCPESEWASRPHEVMKRKRGSAKTDTDYDIRVCGDYVYVNDQCVRLQANAPNTRYLLEKAAGHHAYWYTDMWRQYNQWELHDDSRNVCAIWTPLGLLRPARGQFGLKNMGIVAQARAQCVWHARDTCRNLPRTQQLTQLMILQGSLPTRSSTGKST